MHISKQSTNCINNLGDNQTIFERWNNLQKYKPTHVFMLHGLNGSQGKRKLWLELLFAFSLESVKGLYISNGLENFFNSENPNEPFLPKQFRTVVMPQCYEEPAEKGKERRRISILYYDVEMAHR